MALNHFVYHTPDWGAQQLCEQINKSKDVFSPTFIITGHKDTNDWLKSQIANHLGISCNVQFQKPSDFIQMIYNVLQAGVPRSELIKEEVLTWLIFENLGDNNTDKLRNYFGEDKFKRYMLSVEIAKLFDKYQTETPTLIRNWNERCTITTNEDEKWQSEIWKGIKDKVQERLPDLTVIYDSIISASEDEDKIALLKSKVPLINCFGSLAYTKDMANLLCSLSKHTDVNIFRCNLVDSDPLHGLSNRLGKYTRYETHLLKNMGGEVVNQKKEEREIKSLLQMIQAQLSGQPIPDTATADIDDLSLSIHSHYTTHREVEGLYHYLISLFANDSTLAQRDVCVICSDINLYAPAIKTFFDNGSFKIAYTFYDTGERFHESPFHTLEALLKMEVDSFTSVNVLSLLDYTYIREKFGISDDLSLSKRIVAAANIRHGFKGYEENETRWVSWDYGFKKLIYGLCMKPGMEEPFKVKDENFKLIDTFEGEDVEQILNLYGFVETLFDWLENRNKERTLSEWVDYMTTTLDLFFELEDYNMISLNRILGQLNQANEFVKTRIDFATFKEFMISNLADLNIAEKSGSGGVRFIHPSPFASAPARVYAFLGMNGDIFPSNGFRLSFDLSDSGNPIKADYDKHLFLNLILAAKDKLYISYIGSNIRNNEVISPSSVLDELWTSIRSLCKNHVYSKLEDFTIKHPLHGFSKKYNQQNRGLVRYTDKKVNSDYLPTNQHRENNKAIFERDESGRIVIPLEKLIRFIEDPIKHFYNHVLGIYYIDREEEPEECELFSMGNLESWLIKEKILEASLNGDEIDDDHLKALKQDGLLPLKNLGCAAFGIERDKVSKLVDKIGGFIGHKRCINTVDVEVAEKYRVKGTIQNIYPELKEYLFITSSSNKPKYQIRALVNHKILAVTGVIPGIKLTYVSEDFEKSIEEDKNQIGLYELCELMMDGTKNLYPFAIHLLQKGQLDNRELAEFAIEIAENKDNYYYSDYFKNAAFKGYFESDSARNKNNKYIEILSKCLLVLNK